MNPKRLFLIRHGESQGNVNKEIYKTVPDWAVRLTDNGISQAKLAGHDLYKRTNSSPAIFYSPFNRAIETTNYILSVFKNKNKLDKRFVYEDARLREQEWFSQYPLRSFNYNAEKDRINFGIFHYRFDSGESPADVYDRLSSFVETLHRRFNDSDFPDDIIIVSHGMTMRVLLMVLLNKSVATFETWKNPSNCEIWKFDFVNNVWSFDDTHLKIRNVSDTTRQLDIIEL